MGSHFDGLKSVVKVGQGQPDGEKMALDLKEQAEDFFNEKWTDLKNAYLIYHMNVWETFLFYAGQLWIDWDKDRKIWYPTVPSDDWVPQPRINRFAPAVDAVAANFNTVPDIEAVPANPDDMVKHGIAMVATRLCDYAMRDNALRADYKTEEDKSGYASQLFVLAGCVFTRVFPRAEIIKSPKRAMTDVPTLECADCQHYVAGAEAVPQDGIAPVCPNCQSPNVKPGVSQHLDTVKDEAGNEVMEDVQKWKVVVSVGEPLYAFPRPGSTSMANTPFMIWAERESLDAIYFEFDYEATADSEFADGYSATYEHALAYWYSGFNNVTLQSKDSALVLRLFIEPGRCKEFPDGLYAAMVNGSVIHVEVWPFVENPLTKGDYVQLPKMFFPRSMAFDLVGIQRQLNNYESIIQLHGMTNAVSPWVVDKNTQVSEITGRADKVITYRSIGPGSQPPHREPPGTLDDGIYRKVQALHEEFENITGAVSVFRGQQPGSVTAGTAIDKLKSQAELMFSKPVQNWNALWKETCRKIVKNYQAKFTFQQLIEIVGDQFRTQVADFINSDLDTDLEFVSTVSGSPKTRAERRQDMLDLFDRGALDISDPNVRQQIFELFGETGMMKGFNADALRAHLENRNMQRQIAPAFMPEIEDLTVHLSIHIEQVKALDFDRWPPEAKQLMMNHIMQTKQALQAQAMAQAGTIPPGAPPSEPPKAPPAGPVGKAMPTPPGPRFPKSKP